MRTISVAVSEKHYELFRRRAQAENRSIASLIRDAMAAHLRLTESGEGPKGARQALPQELIPGPGRYRIYAEVDELE
jgi:hypothetical protein